MPQALSLFCPHLPLLSRPHPPPNSPTLVLSVSLVSLKAAPSLPNVRPQIARHQHTASLSCVQVRCEGERGVSMLFIPFLMLTLTPSSQPYATTVGTSSIIQPKLSLTQRLPPQRCILTSLYVFYFFLFFCFHLNCLCKGIHSKQTMYDSFIGFYIDYVGMCELL